MLNHGTANRTIEIERVSVDERQLSNDHVAVEEPLEIQLCTSGASGAAARTLAITMRTPGRDRELALGFLLSEAVIQSQKDVASVETLGETFDGGQNTVRVTLADHVDVDWRSLERHFYTTSSCGVCGKASLDALSVGNATPYSGDFRINLERLLALPAALRKRQRVFGLTGGLHAAATYDCAGDIQEISEDVGRHNAVDKTIGAMLEKDNLPAGDVGLLVSGRASFELVQKALMAGIPMLAAVGAPSSLAVDLATRFNMTLVGFLRHQQLNIYSGTSRVES